MYLILLDLLHKNEPFTLAQYMLLLQKIVLFDKNKFDFTHSLENVYVQLNQEYTVVYFSLFGRGNILQIVCQLRYTAGECVNPYWLTRAL